MFICFPQVPPRSFYKVTVTCHKQEISVPYVAKERFYDANGNHLGENELKGIWHGVSTFAGSAKIEERPLEEHKRNKTESGSGHQQLFF